MLPRGNAIPPGTALPGGGAVLGVPVAGPFGEINCVKGQHANDVRIVIIIVALFIIIVFIIWPYRWSGDAAFCNVGNRLSNVATA